jgi:hypothetical protein
MSQLSDWKRAHICTENHVCFWRRRGSQLREGANAGQHTPTLSPPPSQVYRGNRHYNVCEHVGLDTNQSLHHPPSAMSRGPRVGGGAGPLGPPKGVQEEVGPAVYYITRVRTRVPLVQLLCSRSFLQLAALYPPGLCTCVLLSKYAIVRTTYVRPYKRPGGKGRNAIVCKLLYLSD